jgi:folate-binding protein YgfZ
MSLNSALRHPLRAAADAAVLVDRSALGRLRATGADVPDLLNRLSTNLVDPLETGKMARTILTTNKGRILDVLTLLRAPDHVLILTSAGALEKVAAWLEKYTIIEDATFTDVSAQTAHLALTGPKSPAIVAEALGPSAGNLAPGACAVVPWRGADLLVARTDPLGAPGYDLIAPAQHGDALRQHLLLAGKSLGVTSATHEAWEALRVQAGIPAYGHELTEAYNPLEAGLDGIISWTKGCYIGQEVVARLKTYHKVQRHLVRLALDAATPPPPESKLLVEGKDAGVLTSAAPSPDGKGVLGLGYLRTAFLKDGAGLRVEAVGEDGTRVSGRVTWAPSLPAEALTPVQLMALAAEADAEET